MFSNDGGFLVCPDRLVKSLVCLIRQIGGDERHDNPQCQKQRTAEDGPSRERGKDREDRGYTYQQDRCDHWDHDSASAKLIFGQVLPRNHFLARSGKRL